MQTSITLVKDNEIVLLDKFKVEDFLVGVEGLHEKSIAVDRDRLAQVGEEVGWGSVDTPVYPRVELLARKKGENGNL